jgi:hypothetical protein
VVVGPARMQHVIGAERYRARSYGTCALRFLSAARVMAGRRCYRLASDALEKTPVTNILYSASSMSSTLFRPFAFAS